MQNRSIWKAALSGAIAGLAATYVMTQYQGKFAKLARGNPEKQSEELGDPSTVKVADRISVATTGHHVAKEQKETAGNLIHYGFGTLMGVSYGILSEYVPATRSGFGSAFGSALFVGADEIGVPLAGLSKPPQQTPAKLHLYALSSHLVYGGALEAVRRATRAALGRVA